MKTKKLNKKLRLSKKTIVSLNKIGMKDINGGGSGLACISLRLTCIDTIVACCG